MVKKNIGLVLSLYRYGGGTYQWTVNMLHALEDYRKAQEDVTINIFYSAHCEDYQRMKTIFPEFKYHSVDNIEIFFCKAIFRLFRMAPCLVSFLQPFYPLNLSAHRRKIDLMIFPGASFHPTFYNQNQIFMCADIAHVFYPHFPEVSVHGELRRRHLLYTYGIRQADMVTVESEQLRRDLGTYYQADISKVEVLYQTLSRTVDIEEDLDEGGLEFIRQLPKKYLFYPAQLWEHKNHKSLLLAMKILVEKDQDLVLVLSGSRKEGDEKIFALITELGLQENVKYLGYVSDKIMPVLYRNAQMLVMPTFFGPTNIPTLEAFHFGCPAVISDLPGVLEQTDDAALLFDPNSPEDIVRKIRQVLHDEPLRERMIQRGHARMRALSYENYRNKFFSLIDKAIDGRVQENATALEPVSIDMAILLTGTIIPNIPFTGQTNVNKRKEEYLSSIKFYKQFAPVYFLENSSYPLLADPDFNGMNGVFLRKFSPSGLPGRGKGYQEFEMINQWIATEKALPRRFIKVTGRYGVLNFREIFDECCVAPAGSFLIDRFQRTAVAITRLFFVYTEYYKKNLRDLYEECHDDDGRWVERVLYQRLLKRNLEAKIFRHEAVWVGTEGGTGKLIVSRPWAQFIKNLHRRINYFVEKRFLLYRKGPV